MKKIIYTQCLLRKDGYEQVAYIPQKFATVGRMLRLKGDDGWQVKEVFSIATLDEIEVNKPVIQHMKIVSGS